MRDRITFFLKSFLKSEVQGVGRQKMLGERHTPRLPAVIWLVKECCWMLCSSPNRCLRSTALALGSSSRSLKTEAHTFQRPIISLRKLETERQEPNPSLCCVQSPVKRQNNVEMYLINVLPELVPWDSCNVCGCAFGGGGWGWGERQPPKLLSPVIWAYLKTLKHFRMCSTTADKSLLMKLNRS